MACASTCAGCAANGAPSRSAATWRSSSLPARRRSTLLIDLDVGNLAAGVLLPDVHHVVEPCDVTLLVVAEFTDHSRKLAPRLDGLGDLLRIERICGFRCLLDNLHRGVGVQRVGLRLEILCAELLDHRFGL